MSDVLVVHNPASRRGRRVRAVLETWLRRERLLERTSFCPLEELEQAAVPRDRVVAVGGDGTVNAVFSWIRARGSAVPLGIVPAGTGNNLAAGLGLPLETRAAAEIGFRGARVRGIDAIATTLGSGTQLLLVQSGALGFPAEIGARFDRLRRHPVGRAFASPFGPLAYRFLALAGLAAQKRREARGERPLEVGCRAAGAGGGAESVLDEQVLAVFVHNEPSLGGGFLPCPRASVDDGLIDFCLIRAGTHASYLEVFRRVARGEHLALDDTVVYLQTPGPVEVSLSEPALLLADGELRGPAAAYRFELEPRRLRLLVGTDCAGGGGVP